MRFSQSGIQLWSKCPEAYRQRYINKVTSKQSAAASFGTVVHFALETYHSNGRDIDLARRTFEHYWKHPEQMGVAPEYYLPRTSWYQYNNQGLEMLNAYHDGAKWSQDEIIGLEVPFDLPIGEHTLVGFIDILRIKTDKDGNKTLDAGDFKGFPLDTLLPTPVGYVTMGDVKVGDEVLGANGKPTKVKAKSSIHFNPCYQIKFDDGLTVVADHEHLWEVETQFGTKVLTTEGLAENLRNPATGRRQLKIRLASLDLPEVDLPVDPYVFGCWLGDGKWSSGEITKPDDELFELISARGYEVSPRYPVTEGHSVGGRTVYGLRTQLRTAGLLTGKRVPNLFLRGSRQQRLDLLRGLMDTDGGWHKKRHRAVFNTTDRHIAEAVVDLVAGLGWRPSIFEIQRSGFGKTVTCYDVTFAPVGDNPFQLSRKANLVDRLDQPSSYSQRRLIKSVEKVETVPTQCIQVEADDSLYLVGREMLVTHNTGKKPAFLRYNVQFTAYQWAVSQEEFWADKQEWLTKVEGLNITGTWISLKDSAEVDAGPRDEADFHRLEKTVDQLAKSIDGNIFVPTLSGDSCAYCEYWQECGLPDGNLVSEREAAEQAMAEGPVKFLEW